MWYSKKLIVLTAVTMDEPYGYALVCATDQDTLSYPNLCGLNLH